MARAPAFQFYVRDWLTDEHLVCVAASTRGIWIDFLCHAWIADERGIVYGSRAELCRKLNCNRRELKRFLKDADMHPFCDISEQNGIITIKNRRMLRDDLERAGTRERVKRHRKRKRNTNVTPPSASASASATADISKGTQKEGELVQRVYFHVYNRLPRPDQPTDVDWHWAKMALESGNLGDDLDATITEHMTRRHHYKTPENLLRGIAENQYLPKTPPVNTDGTGKDW